MLLILHTQEADGYYAKETVRKIRFIQHNLPLNLIYKLIMKINHKNTSIVKEPVDTTCGLGLCIGLCGPHGLTYRPHMWHKNTLNLTCV